MGGVWSLESGQPAINHIISEGLPPVGQATARMVPVLGQMMSVRCTHVHKQTSYLETIEVDQPPTLG